MTTTDLDTGTGTVRCTTSQDAAGRLGQAVLRPRSVAILGASDDERKVTSRPLRFLRGAGFSGTVYPINPRRETVLGERAWPSLEALPEVPDHVFVMVGQHRVMDAVAECGRIGVPVVSILSGGFSEGGAESENRKREVLRVAREYGVRIIGPNSIGLANPATGLMLTANATFAESDIPAGTSFVASQSGSVIGAIMTRAKARGIGFAGLVSTGSEIDVTLGELCTAVLDEPAVDSFTLFMESLENAAELAAFATAARDRGKPVTVYKLGRSEAAAGLSVSHTGALAGEDAEADALFRACGFARVDNFEALFETSSLQRRLARYELPRRPRVGVVTSTGGGAAMLVDQFEQRGVAVTRPSAEVFAAIRDTAGADVEDNLIIDLTLAGTRRDKVRATLEILQASGEFDLIAFVIGSSARLNPELAVNAVIDAAELPVPMVAWALPDALPTLTMLEAGGIPSYRTAEACADSVAAVLGASGHEELTPALVGPAPAGRRRTLDELASASVLAGVGVRFPETVVLAPGERPTAPLRYPVVVKGLSDRLPHKSDAGAVVLGVEDADGVARAGQVIRDNVAAARPDVLLDKVIVQEMVDDAVMEVLVGYRRSDTVGPVVVLAAGGVEVELYKDSALRLAPVSREVAEDMVREVRATELARGFRNRPRGDVAALVDAVVAVSRLAVEAPHVVEAELNPVAVRGEGVGVIALDALVTVAVADAADAAVRTTSEAGS